MQIASRSSCSPVNSARSSRSSSCATSAERRCRSPARPTRRSPRGRARPASRGRSRCVERVVELDVVPMPRELGGDLARDVLVVPEVGLAHLGLELGDAGAGLVDRADSARASRGGGADRRGRREVAHAEELGGRRAQRPWQSLNFLPLPQEHGSLRPGVLSARTGTCTTSSSASPRRRHRARRRGQLADELVGRHARRGGAQRAGPCTGSSAARYCMLLVERRRRRCSATRDLHVRDVRDEVVLDSRHHRLEHVEALTLPLGERVLLAHRPEVDALTQVVHLVEVLAPVLVDHRQHHAALDLAEVVGADRLLPSRRRARARRRRGARRACRGACTSSSCSRVMRGGIDHADLTVELVEVPVLGELGDAVGRAPRARPRSAIASSASSRRSPPSRICWRRR